MSIKPSTPFAIPVTREKAAGFAALSEEQKRVVRMRLAIEIGRMSKRKSRAESEAEFRKATATIGNQARCRGLTLMKIQRAISEIWIAGRQGYRRPP